MYLIIIFVHASIISLKDELLLEVHVAFILDVFREPLFWAIQPKKTNVVEDKKHTFKHELVSHMNSRQEFWENLGKKLLSKALKHCPTCVTAGVNLRQLGS